MSLDSPRTVCPSCPHDHARHPSCFCRDAADESLRMHSVPFFSNQPVQVNNVMHTCTYTIKVTTSSLLPYSFIVKCEGDVMPTHYYREIFGTLAKSISFPAY
jgi:hypothetical protein